MLQSASVAPTPAPAAIAAPYQIVGDKINGYVLLDPTNGVVRAYDLKNNRFGTPNALPNLTQPSTTTPANQTAASPPPANDQGPATTPTPPAAPLPQGIAGNATTGVVYFIGNQLAYLADVGNVMARWKPLREMPFSPNTNIQGICGDVVNGIVVHNGDLLALAPDVLAYPTWQSNAISPRLPILHIAGDCTNGVVVCCDTSGEMTEYEDENKVLPSVYKFTGKPYGPATPVQEPKIHIELLFGDGVNGIVAFGENQLHKLDLTKGWSKLASLEFALQAAIGNSKDGLVAIVGADNFLVSTTDCTTWTLMRPIAPPAAPAPGAPSGTASGTPGTPGTPGAAGSAGTAAKGAIVTDGASDPANAAASRNAAQSAPTPTNA